MTEDRLIGSREAADILGIDRSALTRKVQMGRIDPVHRLTGGTGAYIFRLSDILQLQAERDGQQ